jgi:hypothetical protein
MIYFAGWGIGVFLKKTPVHLLKSEKPYKFAQKLPRGRVLQFDGAAQRARGSPHYAQPRAQVP